MRILFLQAGGTIDKAYEGSNNNHGYNFSIAKPASERILQRANPSFEFEVKTILRKDSTDMTDEDRELIYAACRDSSENTIIITHGTDTIIETGKALRDISGKTIVLTGALAPELFRSSDADFNLGTAVGAAAVLEPGVYIAMNGRILTCDEARFDTDQGRFTSNLETV